MGSSLPDGLDQGVLIGRYALRKKLSECFFGTLWLARVEDEGEEDLSLVAVRCIEASTFDDTEAFNRLAEAAFWALEVDFDGQPAVTDVVVTVEHLGVVSRFVEGVTLTELLRRARRSGIAAPPYVALRIASDLLRALDTVERAAESDEEARSGGYAHGGLIPDCIGVGVDGKTRLLDAAVGAAACREPTWSSHPRCLAYRAPEQKDGQQAADARSDTFAVGILLAELLAGEPFAEGRNPDEGTASLDERLSRLELDALLDALVRRALDPDPDARFQRAADMAAAIDQLGEETAEPETVGRYVEACTEEAAEPAIVRGSKPNKVLDDTTLIAPLGYPGSALYAGQESELTVHSRPTPMVPPSPDSQPDETGERTEAREKSEADKEEATTDAYQPLQEAEATADAYQPLQEADAPANAEQAPDEGEPSATGPAHEPAASGAVELPAPPPAAVVLPPAPPPAKRKPISIPTRISTDKIRAWSEQRLSAPPEEATERESVPATSVSEVPLPPVGSLDVPDWLKPGSELEQEIEQIYHPNADGTTDEDIAKFPVGLDTTAVPEAGNGSAATDRNYKTIGIALTTLLLIVALIALVLSWSSDPEAETVRAEQAPSAVPAAAEAPPEPSSAEAAPATEPAPTDEAEPPVDAAAAPEPEPPAGDQPGEAVAAGTEATAAARPSAKAELVETKEPDPAANQTKPSSRAQKTTRSDRKRRKARRPKRRRSYIPDDI